MQSEMLVIVKVPAGSLADELRSRYNIKEAFHEVNVEADMLVFSFAMPSPSPSKPADSMGRQVQRRSHRKPQGTLPNLSADLSATVQTERRRRKARRNRMRTRGWPVVGKIQTSHGQTAVIYRPFVEALFSSSLTPAQQRAKVAEILRSNGNDPSDSSVEYFRGSTLEYLSQANKQSDRS